MRFHPPAGDRAAVAPCPTHAALRAACATRHATLDHELPIARQGAGRAEYRAHLQLLAPFERGLEAALAETPLSPWAARQRARREALVEDLAALGDAADVAPAWPAPPDAAGLWGWLYVAEGSRLGARWLLRPLRHALAPLAPRYLLLAEHDAAWPEFLRALGEAIATPADRAHCVAAAVDAFERLLQSHSTERAA